jgi:hypothetical protein
MVGRNALSTLKIGACVILGTTTKAQKTRAGIGKKMKGTGVI